MSISTQDIHWAAGFLEGEGSFDFHGCTTRIVAVQVASGPLEKLQKLFGGVIRPRPHRVAHHSPANYWCVCGHAASGLMMTLYSLMSDKRKVQIKKALAIWKSRPAQSGIVKRTHCTKGHKLETGRRDCRPCRHDAYMRRRDSID